MSKEIGLGMVRVKSSAIAAVGYDAGLHRLYIEFAPADGPGPLFLYRDVPERVFEELLASPSPGGYYNRHIKGIYVDSQRLSTEGE